MKHALGIGSGAVIYIQIFRNIGSGIQKLIRRIHRQQGYFISLLLFFKNEESRLKILGEAVKSKAYSNIQS
jgi:hypothetical protein